MTDTVSGVPKPFPSLVICQEDSQDTVYSTMHSNCLQSKLSKRRKHMGQSQGETRHKCSRLSPVKSPRVCLILPALNCDNMYELSIRETHQRLGGPDFHWGSVKQTPYAQHIPKFQTSRKKSDVQHNYSVYSLSTVNHSYELGMGGTFWKSEFPGPRQQSSRFS